MMEFVPGATLDQAIAKGPIKLEEAISITIQIADGSLSHKRLTKTISLVCTHSVRTGTSADCSFS